MRPCKWEVSKCSSSKCLSEKQECWMRFGIKMRIQVFGCQPKPKPDSSRMAGQVEKSQNPTIFKIQDSFITFHTGVWWRLVPAAESLPSGFLCSCSGFFARSNSASKEHFQITPKLRNANPQNPTQLEGYHTHCFTHFTFDYVFWTFQHRHPWIHHWDLMVLCLPWCGSLSAGFTSHTVAIVVVLFVQVSQVSEWARRLLCHLWPEDMKWWNWFGKGTVDVSRNVVRAENWNQLQTDL